MVARLQDPTGAATSYVTVGSAAGHRVFPSTDECDRFLAHLETVRVVFESRIYAYALTPTALHLIIRHEEAAADSDAALVDRWARLSSRSSPTPGRLRARLSSLGGLMQTLLQRYSRDRNRRHGLRGRMWASRFRSTFIADDRAVLAAITWLEESAPELGALSCSRHARAAGRVLPTLAAPPLRIGPDEFLFPADESPPGCAPPLAPHHVGYLRRFAATISADARIAYGRALTSGWALGRPESLGAVLQRLARDHGRGRIRRLRELDDELGLCGVWG
ncbi:MAG: hypothetical protein H0V44_09010 [Planctomycetes bacterium]|nr:hypothetical protein [Planctomycetota bacterium]